MASNLWEITNGAMINLLSKSLFSVNVKGDGWNGQYLYIYAFVHSVLVLINFVNLANLLKLSICFAKEKKL